MGLHFNSQSLELCSDTLVDNLKNYLTTRLRNNIHEEKRVSIKLIGLRIEEGIVRKVRQLMGIRNEAELRYCISDPILDGICDAWTYEAKLEESVSEQTSSSPAPSNSASTHSLSSPSKRQPRLEETPHGVQLEATPHGAQLHRMVTGQSRFDYTVYLVTDRKEEIIALVIEAKHTSNSLMQHVLAQVIGYYAAYDIPISSPIAIIITEKYIQPIFFPFYRKERSHQLQLANAIVLPQMNIFKNGAVDAETLYFLLSFSKAYAGPNAMIEIPSDWKTLSRSVFQAHVQTQTQLVESLKDKLRKQGEEMKKKDEEMRKKDEEIRKKDEEMRRLQARLK